jgi:hypothetical protein
LSSILSSEKKKKKKGWGIVHWYSTHLTCVSFHPQHSQRKKKRFKKVSHNENFKHRPEEEAFGKHPISHGLDSTT